VLTTAGGNLVFYRHARKAILKGLRCQDRPGTVEIPDRHRHRWFAGQLGNRMASKMIAVTTGWGGAVPLWGGDVAKRVNFLEQGGSVWVFKLHKG
jgi:hypothetical protein